MELEEQIEEKLINFNWKAILIGLVLSVVLRIGLKYIIPLYGGIISMILACGIAGYLAKGHVLNGALHGGIVGLLEAVIALLLLFYISHFSTDIFMMVGTTLIGEVCLGTIGGCIGNIIGLLIDSKK